jgi:hypothetical protein
VWAGFDKLSVGIKDIGKPAPTAMLKCGIKLIVKYGRKSVGAGSPEFLPPTNNLNKPAPTAMVKCGRKLIVKYGRKSVGAGSPEFLPPTNNLNKPAPNPNRVCFGAGFDQLSVAIKDIGKPAPTSMVKCGRQHLKAINN